MSHGVILDDFGQVGVVPELNAFSHPTIREGVEYLLIAAWRKKEELKREAEPNEVFLNQDFNSRNTVKLYLELNLPIRPILNLFVRTTIVVLFGWTEFILFLALRKTKCTLRTLTLIVTNFKKLKLGKTFFPFLNFFQKCLQLADNLK